MINAARLSKEYGEDSGAAPLAMEPETHKQINKQIKIQQVHV